MPRKKSVEIQLATADKAALSRWHREPDFSKRTVMRMTIIRRAAEGQTNYQIAKELGVSRNTVKLWRYRYAREGLEGLRSRPIPGRPRKIKNGGAAGPDVGAVAML